MVSAFSYYFYYFEKNARPYQTLSRKYFPQLPVHQKQLIHMIFSSPSAQPKRTITSLLFLIDMLKDLIYN